MSANPTVLQDVATANIAEWLDPDVDTPPRGCDLLILPKGGVLIRGPWRDDQGYLAWSPFPRKPAWLQDKMERASLPSTYLFERKLEARLAAS